MTWNCRGNSTMANSDSTVMAQNEANCGARVSTAAVCGSVERAREQRERPVEHDEGDEYADGEEGHQLDDRFRRDRQHQAVLMLGGVGMARAEQHREGRHRQRDKQRDVAEQRLRGAARRRFGQDGARPRTTPL